MAAGQDLLARQQFFAAEDRFLRALGNVPGDVRASVGRIHAPLGAGPSAAAALNLRTRSGNPPDAIPRRYEATLLPGPTRRTTIVAQLRERLGGESSMKREAGLLLAYLGYQGGDRALVDD